MDRLVLFMLNVPVIPEQGANSDFMMKCSQETCEYICNISLAVTTNCQRGQLFRVYVFNKFVTSLMDACLHEGDFAAFYAPWVSESPQYRIEEGCHHLVAHIGIPEHPSAKIFFSRKPHTAVSLLLYFFLYVFEGICANSVVVGFHDMNWEMSIY
jgi:hypothetical protein